MRKMKRPRMEIVKFGTEDVIATSGIGVYSMHVNNMPVNDWFIIMNQEGAKGFSDWMDPYGHYNYGPDTLTLVTFEDGDWFSANAPGIIPEESSIADSSLAEHTRLVYIWYGSGYGKENVKFNTQGLPWSYYLENNIPLPTSTQ